MREQFLILKIKKRCDSFYKNCLRSKNSLCLKKTVKIILLRNNRYSHFPDL